WIGANVEFWPVERVRAEFVNPRYFSAVHYPTAFHINPLNYALALADAAEAAGALIFEDTAATAIDPGGIRKRVDTAEGKLRASHVVLAGNVHVGGLIPQLHAT